MEVGDGRCESVQAAVADEQLEVPEGKGRVSEGVAGILPRTQEEKERDGGHISEGLNGRRRRGRRGNGKGVEQDLDGNRFYAVGRGVGFAVGLELAL